MSSERELRRIITKQQSEIDELKRQLSRLWARMPPATSGSNSAGLRGVLKSPLYRGSMFEPRSASCRIWRPNENNEWFDTGVDDEIWDHGLLADQFLDIGVLVTLKVISGFIYYDGHDCRKVDLTSSGGSS